MQKYWLDIDGNPESFWQHEWTKHGTCMSTFRSNCLPPGSPRGADAVAYFQSTVRMFKTLPTYKWLAEQGITPSNSATYTRSQLFSALKAASGFTPALDCTSGVVSQIYWYFYLQGSAIDGKYVPIDAPRTGNCPSSGIKYTPKGAGSTTTVGGPTTTTRPPTSTTSAAGSLPTKGTVKAVVNGALTGGILTAGTWSTQTLATVTFSGTTSSFVMSTSKGNCAIKSGALECGSGITASSFSAVQSGGNLLITYGGTTSFSSDGTPSGTSVYTVFTGASHSKSYSLSIVRS
ncbi:ribonuclease T2-like protein [Coprinopsis sp. MPI-PUGE-AT-0042]|nr:ribonuclease T2-like protein [Coprinopsis sp. MPI-PUGE-AT-0042]